MLSAPHPCAEKPETCPESEGLPVAKNCRCDPDASSVDCVKGRICFEKKCRTQVWITNIDQICICGSRIFLVCDHCFGSARWRSKEGDLSVWLSLK